MADGEPNFRLLFEQSPDVLLVLLPDAPRYTMVAATRARLLATHTTLEQTLGRGLFELFPDNPDDPAATGTRNLRASLERVLATRAPDTMAVQKYDIRGSDGTFEVRYWSPKNLPVLSPKGEVLYILHRVEDVTELVRASELGEQLRGRTQEMEREVIKRSRELAAANAELRSANAKLGELDAAKTAFFSNVSHEFRTPLTLMLGPIEEALADRAEILSPGQRARLELAHANALRLLKLVNALLEFARMEAGKLRASYAPLDISRFTAELAGMFRSAIEKGGVQLLIDCPPLSEPVFADREMWEKIIPNLISNAFKFTLKGEISVRTREEGDRVVVEVADTGIGIPPESLPQIFARFHRVSASAGRTYEGTGIGLSLVRELVELHGGKIEVGSEVDHGTRFRIEIPKGSGHLAPELVSLTPAGTGMGRDAAAYASEALHWVAKDSSPEKVSQQMRPRVLVVDDNPDLREYLSRLLSPHYEVSTACDGLDALESVRSRRPEIVVSDVMMPRLDGIGLVKHLRGDPRTASLPVILLSARAGEESAVAGLDAGSDDYLVKPFSAHELLARVRIHVELARMRQAWITELENANRELDAFSYSVSHDLRAPLRAIDGFAKALAADYLRVLDPPGKDYLDRIQANAERMSGLIEDLLQLSRITRAPVSAEPVHLSALADELISELKRSQPDRAIEVRIAPELWARGDRRLLKVALVNLLSNAWKFTSRTARPRIEVGWQEADEPTFYVRDNGAGFDMRYAEHLFTPFQRLHSAGEFEGTGVGLATVRRVFARHGGRIWAEAAVGRGATFFFCLPQRRPLLS